VRSQKGAPQTVMDPYGPVMEPVRRSTAAEEAAEVTDVRTVVTLHSRLGQKLRQTADDVSTATTRTNFFISWSQERLRRSIEAIGLSRTNKSQPNAMEGMKVVLEQLRREGLVSVLESMRRQQERITSYA
jgi:4-amino-4-deoxychorismate lyase